MKHFLKEMVRFIYIGILLFLLPTFVLAENSQSVDPLEDCVLFHLDFENGATPVKAAGNAGPDLIRINRKDDQQVLSDRELKDDYLTEGLRGKGLTNGDFQKEIELHYPVEKNLNCKRGTILWWLKYLKLNPKGGGGMVFSSIMLFCRIPDVFVCAYPNQIPLQSELRTTIDRKEGEWMQIGFSWDRQFMHFFCNGKRVASSALSRPFRESEWGNQFSINLFGWKVDRDVAVIDEYTIYNRALTNDEVAAEHVRLAPGSSKAKGYVFSPLKQQSFFYPSIGRIRCDLGFDGYPKAAQVKEARIVVAGPDGKKMAGAVVTKFMDETASVAVDLPKKLPPGNYRVEVSLHGAKGEQLAETVADTFEKKACSFEGNQLGISDKVLPPWIPLQLAPSEQRLSCWGREHTFGPDGLISQVKSQGVDLLARPMSLVARAGGAELKWESGPVQWTKKAPHEVDFTSTMVCKKLQAAVAGHAEYDGMVKYTLTIAPRGDGKVDGLDLVVPIQKELVTLMHGCSDSCRTSYGGIVPSGEGRVWDSTKVLNRTILSTFIPYLWIGNERLGLCWWADKDEGWIRPVDRKAPSIEVVRSGNEVQMVFHLFAQPVELKTPRTMVFAFEATPIRPKVSWARNAGIFSRSGGEGPQFWWFGSSAWALGGTDHYKDYPYNFTHMRPINAECEEWLKKKIQEIHASKRLGLAYTECISRSFTDEVKYYAWEWAKASEPFSKNWVKDRKIYEAMECNSTRSRMDYDLWCINENMKLGMDAWYFDDTFAVPDRNPAAGCGWINEQGEVEPECNLFARREFTKRLYTLMLERGYTEPLIIMHMTSTMFAGPFAFATAIYDYEIDNSDPAKRQLLLLGLDAFRATAMGHQYGFVGTVLNREASSPYVSLGDYQPMRNWTGMQLAHDLNLQVNAHIAGILKDFGYYEPDCKFAGYWEAQGKLYDVEPENIKVSVFRRGNRAMLVFLNTANKDTVALWKSRSEMGADGNPVDADPHFGNTFWHSDERGFRKIFVGKYDYRVVLVNCNGVW